MIRALWCAVMVAVAGFGSVAHGVGLGEIEVRSTLNQRFSARIPLTDLAAEELEGIQAQLAPAADFERAGLERADYLSSLRFSVQDGAAPAVVISSEQLAREPFLSFLLEVRSRNARILREYTVLLDPPTLAASPAPAPAPAAAKPAPAPAPAPAPLAAPATDSEFYVTAEEAAQPAPASAPSTAPAAAPAPAAAAGDGRYGPVQPGETFWSIATRLRPSPAVSMDQVLLAIYRANPQAFQGFNGLQKGSVLRVPTLEQMQATDAAAAKREVDALRAGRRSAAPAPATGSAVAAAPAPRRTPPPAPAPDPDFDPAPAPEPAASAPAVTAPPATASTPGPADSVSAIADAPVPPPSEPPTPATEPVSAEPAVDPMVDPVEETAADPMVDPPAGTAAAPAEPAPSAPVVIREEESGDLIGELLVPLGLGLLVVGGGFVFWRGWKQRRERQSGQIRPAEQAVRVSLPPSGSPLAAKPAPAPRATPTGDTAVLPAAPATPAEKTHKLMDAAQATQQLPAAAAATATAVLPDFDATQVVEASVAATSDTVDFDVTAQFAADTLHINLDGNDPIADADFNLAYGLYDEAALVLKQALAKDPQRAELKLKLAETYFAAARPVEFQELAESAKPGLTAAQWSKLAIMGRQLCPEAALFQGGDDAPMVEMDGGLDLSFDEPAAVEVPVAPAPAAPSLSLELPEILPEPASLPEVLPDPALAAPSAAADPNRLDFALDGLDLPAPAAEPAAAPVAADNRLEFDLGAFELPGEATPPPAAAPAADPNTLAFDLDSLSLGTPAAPAPSASAAADALNLDEIKLDDFDLGDLGGGNAGAGAGDEVATKLDLARAYVDMGDQEMARSLLDEVIQQGGAAQQEEARSLRARLGA
ncbi:MAG TPA: FimV/HubP family polar landmark protein [Nevskiaceae bacterium]|nr:FimV/HubP family polar landmark protein [Nevskiaceae bacterium]